MNIFFNNDGLLVLCHPIDFFVTKEDNLSLSITSQLKS